MHCKLILCIIIFYLTPVNMERLSENDPSSFSCPDELLIENIHLNLVVDFIDTVLRGSVIVYLSRKDNFKGKLILDTRDLNIKNVVAVSTNENLPFTLHEPTLTFGSKLEITLPSDITDNYGVKIVYETSPNSTALQWLKPEQTAGKRHPYLFSQCQAIHARSVMPCQDTPAVKMTYSAEITAPKDLTVLMSALKKDTKADPEDESKMIHYFEQNMPIPSYLLAIVAGAIEGRKIGPRSTVWSEKELIDACAFEFSETETMLKTAEDICGPYEWGVYDLLVLPPSFPYGGMENPCLTFVTPTLLAGDRSLASVVAHEISHSWTGNLVTNRSPEHFWLNEGNTVFVERKIIGRMKGKASQDLSAISGWKTLSYTVNDVFGKNHGYTCLVPELVGVDPDDAFSSVPYEKGFTLLTYLENLLGGPDIFEPFLKSYINHFRRKSIDTNDWKSYLYEYFSNKRNILDTVDWNSWLYSPGMPPVKPDYDTSMEDSYKALASKWQDGSEAEIDSLKPEDFISLSSSQKCGFFDTLIGDLKLSHGRISKLNRLYDLSNVKNCEVRFRWLRLCLLLKYEQVIDLVIEFLNKQGRMKYVRPLYRDMYAWEDVQSKAIENYLKNKDQMHSITATMVKKDLHL